MMKLIQGAFIGVAMVLAAGCASTVSASKPVHSTQPAASTRAAKPPAPPPGATDPRVIVDSTLRGKLRVLGVISSTSRDGLLKIQVDVLNTSDSLLRFGYRVEWFDANGTLMPLTPDEPLSWSLLAGEMFSMVATAPAVTARDFGVAFLAEGN